MIEKNAIILCSGGLDSVVTSYYTKKHLKYKNLIILFFDYCQRALKQEIYFSRKTAEKLKADFLVISLKELKKLSSSSLTNKSKIKEISLEKLKDLSREISEYYVPCRNTIFLSYAMALAEFLFIKTKKKFDIIVGFKNEGREHYPDTTPQYLRQIDKLSSISTKGKFRILAPLINKDKEDIVLIGKKLGVNFKETYSCYFGEEKHCGICLNCRLRQEAFYWANILDETEYSKKAKDYRNSIIS